MIRDLVALYKRIEAEHEYASMRYNAAADEGRVAQEYHYGTLVTLEHVRADLRDVLFKAMLSAYDS